MNKPVKAIVKIYVNPKSRSTEILTRHISKYLDEINKTLLVKIEKVTSANAKDLKKLGITQTPTLLYNGKKYVNLETIIKMITPPKKTKETYGLDVGSPDELIHKYHDGVINAQDEDDEDDPRISRDDEIRRKMAAFQKRRPEMIGVKEEKYIRGGRKVVAKSGAKSKFRSDSEFRQAAGIDTQEATPRKKYFDEQDGDSILEDYYNAEADKMGRKPNHKPIRWSQ